MRRILCIWFPNWPWQRLALARPELKSQAVVLYAERRGLKVVACSRRARTQGIVPGMPVAEAPGARLEKHDPAADRAALEELATWCEQFSPTVGLEEAEFPASLLLDVTGVSVLFGGEEALAEQVSRGLLRRGLFARLALADTVGAAWALSRQAAPLHIMPAGETLSTLAELPVAYLRLSAAAIHTLAELGIHTIGQLLSLARSAAIGHVDPQLTRRLNQATGAEAEPITAHRAMPEIVFERALEYPLEQREAIASLLAQLLDRAAQELNARQQGAIRLECRLDCEGAGPLEFDVGLFQASARSQHLFELAQTRLERLTLPAPVTAIRLAITLTARLQSHQRSLFGDDHHERQQLAGLLDRLSSRLGSAAVVRSVLIPDAQPEYAYRLEPLAGQPRVSRKTIAGIPRLRPLLLEPRPVPLEVLAVAPDGPPIQFRLHHTEHRVAHSWGPERIQTGWWRGNYIRRDYYRVATSAGNRFWLFRRRGEWFLHGVFD